MGQNLKCLVEWNVDVEKLEMLVFQMGPALPPILPGEGKLLLSFSRSNFACKALKDHIPHDPF